jgi:hypothetical protein
VAECKIDQHSAMQNGMKQNGILPPCVLIVCACSSSSVISASHRSAEEDLLVSSPTVAGLVCSQQRVIPGAFGFFFFPAGTSFLEGRGGGL